MISQAIVSICSWLMVVAVALRWPGATRRTKARHTADAYRRSWALLARPNRRLIVGLQIQVCVAHVNATTL